MVLPIATLLEGLHVHHRGLLRSSSSAVLRVHTSRGAPSIHQYRSFFQASPILTLHRRSATRLIGEPRKTWFSLSSHENNPKHHEVTAGVSSSAVSSVTPEVVDAPVQGEEAFRIEKDTWAEKYCPQWMVPYIQLSRVNRPAGTYMLLWPCFWSISLAAPSGQLPDLGLLALFGTGAFIMRSAGCTINDMWDKDFDKQVERTNKRPLASGSITYPQAWGFLAAQLTAGLGILLQLNWYSIALGASSLSLVATYPLMKRVTYWPQAFLGLTFNFGALLGWSAVQGSCDWSVVLPLYAGGIAWTLVYDTLYAHQDKKDDQQIGVRSTALLFGNNTKPILNAFSAAAVMGIGSAGYLVGLDWPFYMGLLGGAGHLVWQVNTAKLDDPVNLQKRFASNKWFGALMFGSIVADLHRATQASQLTSSSLSADVDDKEMVLLPTQTLLKSLNGHHGHGLLYPSSILLRMLSTVANGQSTASHNGLNRRGNVFHKSATTANQRYLLLGASSKKMQTICFSQTTSTPVTKRDKSTDASPAVEIVDIVGKPSDDPFRIEKDTWAEKHCPPSIMPYIQLSRVNRPAATFLFLWPCYWGLILATPAGQLPTLEMLTLFGAGAFLMRTANCTINDMCDKDFDAKVERTNKRPLASGAITMPQAWGFLAAQLGLGLGVLLQLNPYSIALGAASMGFVATYPLMKRVTYWPQAYLGLTINFGALVAYAAVQGFCDWSILLPLYGGSAAWTLVYDTLYAHQDKKDDEEIGVKSTALLFADKTKPILNAFSAAAVLGFGTAGYMAGLAWPYYIGLLGGAGHLAWQVNTADLEDPVNLQKRFASNKWFGAIMFAAMVTGKIM